MYTVVITANTSAKFLDSLLKNKHQNLATAREVWGLKIYGENLHKIYVANVTTTRKNITTIYDIGGLLNAITTYTQSVQTKQAYNTFTQRIFTNELQVDMC